MQYIKIHSQDNVAVALTDIAAGSVVTIDNDSVTLGGISFAATSLHCARAKGENVVKYGLPIGHALADIAPGEHVHAHNTRTNLSDLTRIAINRTGCPTATACGSRSTDLSSRQR